MKAFCMLMLLIALAGGAIYAMGRLRTLYCCNNSFLKMGTLCTRTVMEQNGSGATHVNNFIIFVVLHKSQRVLSPGPGTAPSMDAGSRVSWVGQESPSPVPSSGPQAGH